MFVIIDGEVAFHCPWENIKTVIRVPVPEKAQKQAAYLIFPTESDGLVVPNESKPEPAAFIVNEEAIAKGSGPAFEESPYGRFLNTIFDEHLPNNQIVIQPHTADFVSPLIDAYRRTPAAHVSAHRGSKSGSLWFLSTGILWGLGKPVMFFPHECINSVSFVGITNRTFDVEIHVHQGQGEDEEDAEEHGIIFSMIDQAVHANIDNYVRKHGLHNASLAAQRRAVHYGINKTKDGEVTDVSELQKAIEDAPDT